MCKSILKSVLFCFLFNCSFGQKTVMQEELNKDEIRASMIKALEWQEAHPIFALAPTDWTEGAYYTGVARAHKTTGNQIYEAALKNQGYWNKWQTLDRFYHADDVAISYSYLYIEMNLGRKNFVDLKPTSDFLNAHLFDSNKWRDGTDKDKTKNILWWWCDALFMAPPVITLYAKHVNDPKYLEAMHKFYMQTYNQLYDKEEHLFARDLRFVWTGKNDKKEPNGKKVFWSRGNGWVLAGLALILDDLPKDAEHRSFYENLFKEMAPRILELQPEDGLWRTSLLCPESYDHGEVSGSGFYTFALAWGINSGLLEKSKYLPAVLKSWKALNQCQKEDGMIGWVQNIGAFPEPATADSWQNFGTGAYLLAGSEILKLED